MTPRLQLSSRNEGRDHVVLVQGEIDMDAAPQLLAAVQQGLRRGNRLVVDLSAVPYMDSSGLAVLVQGLKAARRTGSEFLLRHPSARVKAVLQLSQLQQLFEIEHEPETGA